MLPLAIAPVESVENIRTTPDVSGVRVQRKAVYLISRDEPVFGWLHAAGNKTNLDHGVVICPPIGFEQLHAHRSLRYLADKLAEQGIPTLRFDWHGTGDSAGCDEDPARRQTWHTNVRDAVKWMYTQAGCRRVSVVGLRMGAMLAAEALDEDWCEHLVLWAPVANGRAYVRQSRAIEKMAEARPQFPGAAAGDIEVAGFLLSEETAAQLSQASLSECQVHCRSALLVAPFDKGLAERLASLGIAVEQISPPGFAEMMVEPHLNRVPEQAVHEIVQWLAQRISADSIPNFTLDLTLFDSSEVLLSQRTHTTASDNPQPTIRERALHFGDGAVFGIMSEPAEPANDLPMIVLLNSGSANRSGPGRFGVHLARHLVGQGFRCLRIDARGLGDSLTKDAADENDPYPMTMFRDIELTMQELRTRFGMKRCVLVGVCSGACAAFQSAAQLSEPMLVESVLINPLTFSWQEGMDQQASKATQVMEEHCYMARALNLRKLWKFITGGTKIGYVEAARILQRRLWHVLKSFSATRLKPDAMPPTAAPEHSPPEDLPVDLARVVAAGRTLAMFLAENEPGYTIMMHHARRQVRQLLRQGALQVFTIKHGDHTFSRRAPRADLIRSISDYLCRRYQESARFSR